MSGFLPFVQDAHSLCEFCIEGIEGSTLQQRPYQIDRKIPHANWQHASVYQRLIALLSAEALC